MTKNHYIYLLYDVKNPARYLSYEVNKIGRKIGSTCNMKTRMKPYLTGHPDKVPLECYYLIKNPELYTCYEIDNMIKINFDEYRLKGSGGIEFYDYSNVTQQVIEDYFNQNNIEWEKLHIVIDEDPNITLDDIDNLKYDVEQNIYYSRKNEIVELNKLEFLEYQYMDFKINLLNEPEPLLHQQEVLAIIDKRDRLQNEYVEDILNNLTKYNKVLVKAPTGFGKTVVIYKSINKLKSKKILIFTPRINLNKQFVDAKYTKHLINNYVYTLYSNSKEDDEYKNNLIKEISNSNKNTILLSCYQSRKSLIKNIKEYNLIFDLVIFDEAHFISGWIEKIKDETNTDEIFLLNDNTHFINRIFTTATPVDDMILNNTIFGNLVEKVKIYELVNDKILCNIETIIKKLDNKKHEYSDLSKLVEKSMIRYDKRKGIIYVNDCKNATNLYNIMKNNDIIKPYLYISKEVDDIDSEEEKDNFESTDDKAVIIAVGKIGYGYDNDDIDFICFGDSRTSDIDIRQIIGRGLRWNKILYPNKILHVLVPCYKNELEQYDDNRALDAYMNYIISEYGNDDISKIVINYNSNETNDNIEGEGKKYDGSDVPIEIYTNWCTTGHNMYSIFMIFLKLNNVIDEMSYNNIYQLNNNWMINLGELQIKYPKFCFRDIHPNNTNYYWNKKDALDAYEICNNQLIIDFGKEKYRRYNSQQKLEKINELDKKIPIINFDLYYPKDP